MWDQACPRQEGSTCGGIKNHPTLPKTEGFPKMQSLLLKNQESPAENWDELVTFRSGKFLRVPPAWTLKSGRLGFESQLG